MTHMSEKFTSKLPRDPVLSARASCAGLGVCLLKTCCFLSLTVSLPLSLPSPNFYCAPATLSILDFVWQEDTQSTQAFLLQSVSYWVVPVSWQELPDIASSRSGSRHIGDSALVERHSVSLFLTVVKCTIMLTDDFRADRNCPCTRRCVCHTVKFKFDQNFHQSPSSNSQTLYNLDTASEFSIKALFWQPVDKTLAPMGFRQKIHIKQSYACNWPATYLQILV
jgi:hypothetical protein